MLSDGVEGGNTTKEFPAIEDDEELCWAEEDGEEEFQRGNKIKVRESKRTLVSKGESGFVSENTLNNSQLSNHFQFRLVLLFFETIKK